LCSHKSESPHLSLRIPPLLFFKASVFLLTKAQIAPFSRTSPLFFFSGISPSLWRPPPLGMNIVPHSPLTMRIPLKSFPHFLFPCPPPDFPLPDLGRRNNSVLFRLRTFYPLQASTFSRFPKCTSHSLSTFCCSLPVLPSLVTASSPPFPKRFSTALPPPFCFHTVQPFGGATNDPAAHPPAFCSPLARVFARGFSENYLHHPSFFSCTTCFAYRNSRLAERYTLISLGPLFSPLFLIG